MNVYPIEKARQNKVIKPTNVEAAIKSINEYIEKESKNTKNVYEINYLMKVHLQHELVEVIKTFKENGYEVGWNNDQCALSGCVMLWIRW